ncbi:hypothetical protein [Pimelobacter sp. 30-1]|uniref:hypothetical protein n=1 Tax=Pimelobacter sp. 30-1 TaxID=2004991 RepID=UPI001C0462AD|nr:hypothetical protein [Pimelobacter sp. 30-1]MBU2694357.1 hypothetical protein [Pimelobacter sp. 30-1]
MPAMEAAVPASATARVQVGMSGHGRTMDFDAVLAYEPDGASMEMTSRTPGEEFSMIVVDDRYFIAEPDADAGYREVSGDDPLAVQLRSQFASADLTTTFAAWRAGLEKVEVVGEEEIDGRPTCHYRLKVDMAEAGAARGDDLPAGGPPTVDYELFLQRDDLMRRVRFDVLGAVAEMNATRWNEPVSIEVPAGH